MVDKLFPGEVDEEAVMANRVPLSKKRSRRTDPDPQRPERGLETKEDQARQHAHEQN